MGGSASVLYLAAQEPLQAMHEQLALFAAFPWPRIASCQCGDASSESSRNLARILASNDAVEMCNFVALDEAERGVVPHCSDGGAAQLLLVSRNEAQRLIYLVTRQLDSVSRDVAIIDVPLVIELTFHHGAVRLTPFTYRFFHLNFATCGVENLHWILPESWNGQISRQTVSTQERVLTFALCLKAHKFPKDLIRLCVDEYFASRCWSDLIRFSPAPQSPE